MPYTTLEQIRNYIADHTPLLERISDQPLVLSGTSPHQFFHGTVAGDISVKVLRTHTPIRSEIILAESGNVISAMPIVRCGVLVASDSSLGTVYTENLDYVINYDESKLSIKVGGLLSIGAKVTVFCLSYHRYSPGVDYSLDPAQGTIKRLSGGSIADAETVLIDYTPTFLSATTELLSAAVVTANALIEREIDPNGLFESDLTLGAAATYRALEIVSRAIAVRELSASCRANSPQVASSWLQLALQYDNRSRELLALFRPPIVGPTNPTRT